MSKAISGTHIYTAPGFAPNGSDIAANVVTTYTLPQDTDRPTAQGNSLVLTFLRFLLSTIIYSTHTYHHFDKCRDS